MKMIYDIVVGMCEGIMMTEFINVGVFVIKPPALLNNITRIIPQKEIILIL